jgi:hypothetical protein
MIPSTMCITLMDLVTNTTNDSIDHVYNFNGSGYYHNTRTKDEQSPGA